MIAHWIQYDLFLAFETKLRVGLHINYSHKLQPLTTAINAIKARVMLKLSHFLQNMKSWDGLDSLVQGLIEFVSNWLLGLVE